MSGGYSSRSRSGGVRSRGNVLVILGGAGRWPTCRSRNACSSSDVRRFVAASRAVFGAILANAHCSDGRCGELLAQRVWRGCSRSVVNIRMLTRVNSSAM